MEEKKVFKTELTDDELLTMTGGATYTPAEASQSTDKASLMRPLYGIKPLYGVIPTQPLYGIKPLYGVKPLYGIKPTLTEK
ncbi:MAG TPA: hypothetical protein VF941_08695 [Clostridia bacterium]